MTHPMRRPPDALKAHADALAAAATQAGAHLADLFRLAEVLGGAAEGVASPTGVASPMEVDGTVGIWAPGVEEGDACYLRRAGLKAEWPLWADVHRIEARSDKWRIALVGESVARGYLYDPLFSPAMVLQRLLEAILGPGEVEVVDLARSNLSYEVRELALASLRLQPDILVVFAGNNWGMAADPSPDEVVQAFGAAASNTAAALQRLAEARIRREASRVVSDIAAGCAAHGVPLLWIIPEHNLGDWRDPDMNPPHLEGRLHGEWLALREAARDAAGRGDRPEVKAIAERMATLDGGLCPTSLYLLADLQRESGDVHAARASLERARDATMWDSTRTVSPRTFSVTQDVLRHELSHRQCSIVDVPVLFERLLAGHLPDRRLFLDYCHLTTQGMQVVMGAAASEIVRLLPGVQAVGRITDATGIAPSSEVEAEAALLAAIHNAHWHQSPEIVGYHCARALALSPHVAELMRDYVEAQAGYPTPLLLSAAGGRLHRCGSAVIHHYLFRNNVQVLDRVLTDAILDALAEGGSDQRSYPAGRPLHAHSVARRPCNLLDYFYLSSTGQPHEAVWASDGADARYPRFYRAYDRTSRFLFIADAGVATRLITTWRVPDAVPGRCVVTVEVNSHLQGTVAGGKTWSTWDLLVDGSVLHDGINEILVYWPARDYGEATSHTRDPGTFEGGKPLDPYPVYGEIHSLMARCDRTSVPQGSSAVGDPSSSSRLTQE